MERVRKQWIEWPGREWDRRLLIAAGILFVAQAFLYLTWFVDDAAISMTYARNLAAGRGLVLYPGGEHVEAYSNPLWVFVLAVGAFIGANLFAWTKALAILFGLGAVYRVARVGARLQGVVSGSPSQPGSDGVDLRVPALDAGSQVPIGGIAALLTAAHTPFVAWTTSGLEGGLYLFLLFWAAEALLAEASTPSNRRVPWSGLLFFFLAITRPEGILFFVAAVGVKAVWDWWALVKEGKAVSWTHWAAWVGLFIVPWVAYQLWHYAEFAALVTNTYYVKRPETPLLDRFLNTGGRGWRNVRNWAEQYRLEWTLPVSVLGVLARRDRLCGEDRGWLLVAALFLAALFFPLYADGDWMREFRFLVPAAPLTFLLFAGGLDLVGRGVPRSWHRVSRYRVSFSAVVLWIVLWFLLVPNFWSALKFVYAPEVSVADVKQRSDYFKAAREALQLEDPVVFLDPDLGATSYFSGMHVADTWGLADVPFAVHRYDQAFVADYVFDELQPDFAHVFGYWNSRVKILQDPRWRSTFLALPPYRNLKGGLDGGNYVNRKHIRAAPGEVPSDRPPLQVFQDGLELVHATIEPRAVRPGGEVTVKLYWRVTRKQTREALFVTRIAPDSGTRGQSVDLDHLPIYGWYPLSRWRTRTTYKETYRIHVPPSMAEGRYHLVVQVEEPGSGISRPVIRTEQSRSRRPLLMVGSAAAERLARSLGIRARQLLAAGMPEEAHRTVARALRLGRGDSVDGLDALLQTSRVAWRDQVLDNVQSMFARDPLGAARVFRPAYWRWLDDPTVLALGRDLGARASTRARTLETRGDLSTAFDAYLAAVWFDPARSSDRRRAEALRMRRDRPALPPGAQDDTRIVRHLMVGLAEKGKLARVRGAFQVGEQVMCQVYWRERLPARMTRWLWFDPQGEVRFKQRQRTAAGTRLSYATIEVPRVPGDWTVEVRVGEHPVGTRRFHVRR